MHPNAWRSSWSLLAIRAEKAFCYTGETTPICKSGLKEYLFFRSQSYDILEHFSSMFSLAKDIFHIRTRLYAQILADLKMIFIAGKLISFSKPKNVHQLLFHLSSFLFPIQVTFMVCNTPYMTLISVLTYLKTILRKRGSIRIK